MLAVACAPETPRWWTSLAPTTSPPTPATGKSVLTDSRIQRIHRKLDWRGRFAGGNSSRQETASKYNGMIWNRVIGMSHQPSASIAEATSAAPLWTTRKTTSRKPKRAAKTSDVEMIWLPVRARSPQDCAGLRSPGGTVYQQSSPRWSDRARIAHSLAVDLPFRGCALAPPP